jgi:hypothetical protein
MSDEEKVVSTEVVEEPKEIQAEPEEPKTEEVVKAEPEAVEPPKPKKTAQERIDELTRKRRDAERDAEYWKAKALQQKEEPKPVDKAPEVPEPTLDQFDTTEQYVKALIRHERQQEEARIARERRENEVDTAYRTYEQRASKARAEHEDFDEAVNQTLYTDTMKMALWKIENGPEIAYHIAVHPTEGERIRSLPPDMQIYELGKLETKLLLAKQTKKVPGAPPPITPVGTAGGTRETEPSQMSMEEWMAWDKKQTEERLKQKKPWLFPK